MSAATKKKQRYQDLSHLDGRKCIICEAEIVRRRSDTGKIERISLYTNRTTCSKECRQTNRFNMRGLKSKRTQKTPDKTCTVCSSPFNRNVMPDGRIEDIRLYRTRKTCSEPCADVAYEQLKARIESRLPKGTKGGRKLIIVADKLCAVCGTPFNRKVMGNGKLEGCADFHRRKSCSKECVRRPPNPKRTVKIPKVWELPKKRPEGAQFESEFGLFKKVNNRTFRWDGLEWVRSNIDASSFKRVAA